MREKIIKFWISILGIIIGVMLIMTCSMLTEAEENEWPEIQAYIEDVCKDYNICPQLVEAIIETESSKNPYAQNGDCIGLMQISERWHRERMNKLGVTDLRNPYENILVGVDYLYELSQKYPDVGYALMAYNGDSRLNQYMESGKLSEYAIKILERSAELEREAGK